MKNAAFDHTAAYPDFGSSSECYFNDKVLELETLGPICSLAPGASVTHIEEWELFRGVEEPVDDAAALRISEQLGLD